MRVGEILLEHGWVDAPSLKRAIGEQRHTGKRLCSLLIARGLVDPDHAARALGQQHQVASALQRHLENRDPALIKVLNGELARTSFALPIGRSRDGDVIVCVRDPRPELLVKLERAIGGRVVMAVAPATQLEKLIDLAYEPTSSDEYDVDLTTGPIVPVEHETAPVVRRATQPSIPAFRASEPAPRASEPAPRASEPAPRASEPAMDGMPDLSSLTLVGLDDHGVDKDPSQSGQLLGAGGMARPQNRPSVTPPSRPFTIDETVAALGNAGTQDVATDVAMQFAAVRWASSLLLAIREGAALGSRGHGAQLPRAAIESVVIPLSAPSIVKVAHDWRRLANEPPQGAGTIQERLVVMLGNPRAPAAIPIVVATQVACVLAVGDPIGSGEAGRDLARLASALGEAYTRVMRAE